MIPETRESRVLLKEGADGHGWVIYILSQVELA